MDEPDAVLELRLLMVRGSVERPLEVVQDRKELAHELLVRAPDEGRLVAGDTLAVVVEVGREALEPPSRLLGALLRLGSASAATSSTALAASSASTAPLRGVGASGADSSRRSRRRAPRLLVDHLVVGLLDDLVVRGRGAVAAGCDAACSADACA